MEGGLLGGGCVSLVDVEDFPHSICKLGVGRFFFSFFFLFFLEGESEEEGFVKKTKNDGFVHSIRLLVCCQKELCLGFIFEKREEKKGEGEK